MSDLHQINTALERLFVQEGHRIVFWNDPEKEFPNTLPFPMLDGVTTLRLDEVGALEVKIRIEKEEPTSKFLLYSPVSSDNDSPRATTNRISGPLLSQGLSNDNYFSRHPLQ